MQRYASQLVANRLRHDCPTFGADAPLGELDQLLTGQLAFTFLAEPGLANRLQADPLGSAQWDAFVLFQITVDDVDQELALAAGPVDGTRLGQFRLPPAGPGLGGLQPVECLAFLIDLRTIAHDPYLRCIAERSVPALPLFDGRHNLVHEVLRLVLSTSAPQRQAETG